METVLTLIAPAVPPGWTVTITAEGWQGVQAAKEAGAIQRAIWVAWMVERESATQETP